MPCTKLQLGSGFSRWRWALLKIKYNLLNIRVYLGIAQIEIELIWAPNKRGAIQVSSFIEGHF